ncbi:hypothetical protein A1O3_08304 [Capronia epimyces CBS 606.96]|uniref:Suppressor protein SRP40 n=1 Tax=Capronia epimyces CBS 606.96 TaxID=1182542 RepID=W9XII5_9EURO|nr:uncharacterized protein A1O3_08304 [Capronia epimyces CBS 606.96]EXJ80018.1 hypothetical protein A1O3_08304 [Capronia epimyces CBS 606.96]
MTVSSMRLHITPFSPDLLRAIVGPRLLDQVSNLSFHTIQTFPENNYGYFDLPIMEAERIKKKLNGAILKGKKIKIEEARPTKRKNFEETTEDSSQLEPSTAAKRSKTERNVILGHELSANRKVKRGWTEADRTKSGKKGKGKVSSTTSKFTDKDELLFRTKVPPNKTESGKRGKSKKNLGQHVVHEFEHSTTQPSFLRQDDPEGSKGNLEYVDGTGWIDEAGRVVEPESERILARKEALQGRVGDENTKTPSDHSSTTSDLSSDDDKNDANRQNIDETSSSGSSSETASVSEADEDTDASAVDEDRAGSGAASDLEPSAPPEVHPLEVLFKKPSKPASQDIAKPSLEISTSFSFFDAGNEDDVDEAATMPGTPFTTQDLRSRGLRSAAPTPDTAHPSRFNSYDSSGLPDDEESEDDDDNADGDGTPGSSLELKKPVIETPSRKQSEFEKNFWQNRGENNRAWKLRRRNVLKEKRQRENKARRPKNW